MSPSKPGSVSSSPKIRGWVADLGLLVAMLALGIAMRPPAWDAMRALEPRPDALEYCVSALHLASGHGFVLRVGQADYPPRWEPGFPLALAAWYRVAGLGPESAAALQSLLSVVSIALIY